LFNDKLASYSLARTSSLFVWLWWCFFN